MSKVGHRHGGNCLGPAGMHIEGSGLQQSLAIRRGHTKQ